MKKAAVLVVAVFLGGCVPYPAELLDDGRGSTLPSLVTGAFPGLDAGAAEQQSLHFHVRAYGTDTARQASDSLEQSYTRIMNDTALYSFQPHGTYEVVVYGSREEYRRKTGQPQWSAGVTVGNSIYSYVSGHLEGVLAHETTHLIWYEYMGGNLSGAQRWVNEGLAVYEEATASNRGAELFASFHATLRSAPIPMDQLQNLAPNSEQAYDASMWYAEAEGLVRFMIERGGRIGFGQFLNAVRMNQTFDQAVVAGFPGQWRTLADLAADWQRSL